MAPMYFVEWCWIAFIVFWALTLLWSKKAAKRTSISERLDYMLPLVIGVILDFGFWSGATGTFGTVVVPHVGWVEMLANILALLGVALAIWARVTLGNNWSGSVQVKQGHELVTKGPYAFVRHPIYTALLLLFLATAFSLGTLPSFVGFLFVLWSCSIKYKQEERFMTEQFPDQYPQYRKRVAALIPFIF